MIIAQTSQKLAFTPWSTFEHMFGDSKVAHTRFSKRRGFAIKPAPGEARVCQGAREYFGLKGAGNLLPRAETVRFLHLTSVVGMAGTLAACPCLPRP